VSTGYKKKTKNLQPKAFLINGPFDRSSGWCN